MNCNQIQELILSDYSDKESTAQVDAAVKAHLSGCPECREYLALVKKTREPFKRASELTPPAHVWFHIKDSLIAQQDKPIMRIWERFSQALAGFVSAPKIAFATTAMTVVVVGTIMFQLSAYRSAAAVQDYFGDQADFLASLGANGQYSRNADALDFESITENLL